MRREIAEAVVWARGGPDHASLQGRHGKKGRKKLDQGVTGDSGETRGSIGAGEGGHSVGSLVAPCSVRVLMDSRGGVCRG